MSIELKVISDSVTYMYIAMFVKPQQWPTPSESITIYCVRKLVSCITHLQSCAKVDIWNKKEKLRTVAKTKTQDYKNWRLQKFFTFVTPPLNTAATLFNEHRSQRQMYILSLIPGQVPTFWAIGQYTARKILEATSPTFWLKSCSLMVENSLLLNSPSQN